MKKITSSNLPNLGIEPFKRFDENNSLTDVLYSFLNGSTISISFDQYGYASEISYNGRIIPNYSQLELVDDKLHIIMSTV